MIHILGSQGSNKGKAVDSCARIEFDGEQAHVELIRFTGEPSLYLIGGGRKTEQVGRREYFPQD